MRRHALNCRWGWGRLATVTGFGIVLAAAAESLPLEFLKVPVNGTDALEDPVAVRANYGFTLANKVVEHGDTITLQDSFTAMDTPHVAWAKPYAGGPIRVLVIVAQSRNIRQAIELRQRSDFDITTLILPGMLSEDNMPKSDPAAAAFYDRKFQEIMARDYDAILFGMGDLAMRGNSIPAIDHLLAAIESKVRNGTGLVLRQGTSQWWRTPKPQLEMEHALSPLTYENGGNPAAVPQRASATSPVTAGFSFANWPVTNLYNGKLDPDAELLATVSGKPLAVSGRYGNGRVVAICVQDGLIPDADPIANPRFDDYWEPVYAVYLKALAWVANREPAVALRVPDVTVAKAGEAPQVQIGIGAATGTARKLELQYHLQDQWGNDGGSGTAKVTTGTEPQTVTVALPVCRAEGLHRLDLWLKDGDKVVDWGSTAVRIDGGVRLEVKSLTPLAAPGGTVRYQVGVGIGQGQLTMRGIDDAERVFVQQTVTVRDGAEVELSLQRSCLPRNRVEFSLSDGKDVVARRTVPLYVPRIGLGSAGEDFVVASYGLTPVENYLEKYLGGIYREAGLNAVYMNWHNRAYIAPIADAGLYCITGSSWVARQANLDKELKECPNKPEVLAARTKVINQAKDDARIFGGISRVLDDETWFAYTVHQDGEMHGAQACQCANCLKLFREAMQAKYGEIAKLNDVWGTAFASFADVRVIEEAETKGGDNPSGWLEFRQFMNRTYANYYGWVTAQHQDLVPDYGAGCGAPHWTSREGGPTYRGGDFSMLKDTMRFLMAYGGTEARQFPHAFVGQPGGQKYDPPLEWTEHGSWYHLLNGADALWYYYGSAIIGTELAWRRHAAWVQQGVRDIRDGIGVLVSRAQPLDRQVRILYSSENLAMAWLFAKRTDAWNALGLNEGASQTAQTMESLFDNFLSIQPGTVFADDIRRGDLKDCRLLILPQILNLDDETAAAIKEFVRNGGCVVADVMPGTRGQFGKPRAQGALDELFGVDSSKARIHKENEVWYSAGIRTKLEQDQFAKECIWLPANLTFLNVTPTTAKSQGEVLSKIGKEAQACFVNSYGKGKALLLNFQYRDLNTETCGWHRLFGEALANWAGLQPPATIVNPQTHAPLAYRPLRAFRRGDATLLGCIRGRSVWSGGAPILIDPSRALDISDAAEFTWPDKKHAYDVRAGKYLGFGTSAKLELPSFQGRLLALLPYRVTDVRLTVPARVKAGEGLEVKAAVQAEQGKVGEHVLRLKVFSPTGYENLLYCRTRTAADGTAGFTIPFADNDRPGKWTVVVRDAMTGVESRTTVLFGAK